MESKLKNSVIIAFGILVIFACKKEKPPIPLLGVGCSSIHCPEMYQKRTSEYPDTFHFTDTQPNCITMWEEFHLQKRLYGMHFVNPNNEYEFSTIRTDPDNPQLGAGELCIYNFCSNQINVLTDNARSSTSWSINDWILIAGDDFHIYKIKSDGTNKEKLTNGGINIRPKWSPDGTKFVYRNKADNPNRLRICDENGELLQSIMATTESWNWLNNDEVLFAHDGYIKKYNLVDESITIIMNQQIESLQNIYISLTPINDEIYFVAFDGLYVLDSNGDHYQIESNYYTYQVNAITRLNDDKLLLYRSAIDTSAYPCTVYATRYTSIYDIETQSERYIKKLTELK